MCQLDALRKCLKLDALRKALNSLPKTLDDTYSRILSDLHAWWSGLEHLLEFLGLIMLHFGGD